MSFNIGKSKREDRASHWKDIQTRVTTHEGEILHGSKGREYQQKWSKDNLGRDIGNTRSVDVNDVERYEKTKG